MLQQALPFHGGPRPNSGRPKTGRTPHASRPRFHKPTPVHVTLRVKRHVWNLRSGRSFRRIRDCFKKARGRFPMRLIEFSVLGNHLHLIVEADGNDALSKGMQGVCIRIAKALNSLMEHSGRVFDDHYFSRLLKTPTELVRAIRYVLENHRRHYGDSGPDPFSSAIDRAILDAPVGWLLREGFKKAKTSSPGTG